MWTYHLVDRCGFVEISLVWLYVYLLWLSVWQAKVKKGRRVTKGSNKICLCVLSAHNFHYREGVRKLEKTPKKVYRFTCGKRKITNIFSNVLFEAFKVKNHVVCLHFVQNLWIVFLTREREDLDLRSVSKEI
jgi:hypothetical protein